MIFLNNKDLIGSPNKTSNTENLFDFIKNRVKMSLCVSEKFVLNWCISNRLTMNKTQEQLEKLREVAEASLTKTEELQKVLAQIEALMSREEAQKVSQKNK